MNRLRTDRSIVIRLGVMLLLGSITARWCIAQAVEYQEYLRQIEELDRTGSDIARSKGKAALISEYRALIDSNPNYANNLQLETQIGYVYEWDLSPSGEGPDMKAAYDHYVAVAGQYDPNQPYMKTVRELAANRAVTVDPKAANDLYQGLVQDFPEDSALTEESMFYLGRLAEERGDTAEAQKYYEAAIRFQPAQEPGSEAETNTVEAYRANAALGLLTQAIKQSDDPEVRTKALEDFLTTHPGFADAHADLIERVRDTLQQQGTQHSSAPLSAALQNLASTLGGGSKKTAIPGGGHAPNTSSNVPGDHSTQGAGPNNAKPNKGAFSTASASNPGGPTGATPITVSKTLTPYSLAHVLEAFAIVVVGLTAVYLVRRRLQ